LNAIVQSQLSYGHINTAGYRLRQVDEYLCRTSCSCARELPAALIACIELNGENLSPGCRAAGFINLRSVVHMRSNLPLHHQNGPTAGTDRWASLGRNGSMAGSVSPTLSL